MYIKCKLMLGYTLGVLEPPERPRLPATDPAIPIVIIMQCSCERGGAECCEERKRGLRVQSVFNTKILERHIFHLFVACLACAMVGASWQLHDVPYLGKERSWVEYTAAGKQLGEFTQGV